MTTGEIVTEAPYPEDWPDPFRYTSFFSFLPDAPDWVRSEFVRRWKAFMDVCIEPQWPELNPSHPSGKGWTGSGYDFCSTMVFRSSAECEAYLSHPLHLSLHAELVEPYVDMKKVFGGRHCYAPLRHDPKPCLAKRDL